jgi:hypothetical protein
VGALAGLAATIPHLLLAALAACGAVTIAILKRPRPPVVVLVIPMLSFIAAVLPGLPDVETLRVAVSRYVELHAQWTGLEELLLGQRPVGDAVAVWGLWHSGRAGPLDVPLGALLSPFAIPRTPLRLWGDVLLDPFGAALVAVGIAVCVRSARRANGARVLLLVLVLALLPGMLTSAYDRASPTRNVALCVVAAVLACVGFERLRATVLPRVRPAVAAGVAAVLVALAGTLVFDVVNPGILATSWLSLALTAVQRTPPPGGAVLLQHGTYRFQWDDPRIGEAARVFRRLQPAVDSARENPDAATGNRSRLEWLHVERIATYLPRQPIAVRSFDGPESLLAAGSTHDAPAEVIIWSPGLEADAQVTRTVCERWSGAALYTLIDRAGQSRAFAARPAGPGWKPALPASQWSVASCAESIHQ